MQINFCCTIKLYSLFFLYCNRITEGLDNFIYPKIISQFRCTYVIFADCIVKKVDLGNFSKNCKPRFLFFLSLLRKIIQELSRTEQHLTQKVSSISAVLVNLPKF